MESKQNIINITQLNCDKSGPNHDIIALNFSELINPINIALLQEPHTTSDNKVTNFYDSNHNTQLFTPIIDKDIRPKVCTLANKHLNFIHATKFDHQDMIICKMNTKPLQSGSSTSI